MKRALPMGLLPITLACVLFIGGPIWMHLQEAPRVFDTRTTSERAIECLKMEANGSFDQELSVTRIRSAKRTWSGANYIARLPNSAYSIVIRGVDEAQFVLEPEVPKQSVEAKLVERCKV